ncbi:MAG: 3-isopropylmalate dehydrogenase [Dehalococcoidales bacterium]|nr:3-isopropylmalate dehydrogenase [Dehalococcoidales bacterium]
MKFNIMVLPGDGVGTEVAAEGIKVLQAIGKKYRHSFVFARGLVGGAAIDVQGTALAAETLALCKKSDAVLFGAVGGPKWDDPKAKVRPEDGILALRKGLGLFANLRPMKLYPMLVNTSPIKADIVRGSDFIFVRELTGGLYFGRPKKRWQTTRGWRAVDTMAYSEKEIDRILRVGFELARSRRKRLVSVDKANVLETSRLWRQIATELAKEYSDVTMEHMLVDSCSMRLIQQPTYFDVMVTENTFGDILTDEASMLAGSMGMMPSASLAAIPREGEKSFGLYEPIHGSAPKRAGQNMANPIATILSAAMLLRYSLALRKEAQAVETAVEAVLQDGYRTYDIMSEGMNKVSTGEMGDLIARKIG